MDVGEMDVHDLLATTEVELIMTKLKLAESEFAREQLELKLRQSGTLLDRVTLEKAELMSRLATLEDVIAQHPDVLDDSGLDLGILKLGSRVANALRLTLPESFGGSSEDLTSAGSNKEDISDAGRLRSPRGAPPRPGVPPPLLGKEGRPQKGLQDSLDSEQMAGELQQAVRRNKLMKMGGALLPPRPNGVSALSSPSSSSTENGNGSSTTATDDGLKTIGSRKLLTRRVNNVDVVTAVGGEMKRPRAGTTRSNNIARWLSRIPLLSSLNPQELDVLVTHLEEENFRDGHVLMRQGEDGDRFYLIVSGSVNVYVESQEPTSARNRSPEGALASSLPAPATARNGRGPSPLAIGSSAPSLLSPAHGNGSAEDFGIFIRKLETGNYFGEMALLQNTKRSATVVACGQITCMCLGQAEFALLKSRFQHTSSRRERMYTTFDEACQTKCESVGQETAGASSREQYLAAMKGFRRADIPLPRDQDDDDTMLGTGTSSHLLDDGQKKKERLGGALFAASAQAKGKRGKKSTGSALHGATRDMSSLDGVQIRKDYGREEVTVNGHNYEGGQYDAVVRALYDSLQKALAEVDQFEKKKGGMKTKGRMMTFRTTRLVKQILSAGNRTSVGGDVYFIIQRLFANHGLVMITPYNVMLPPLSISISTTPPASSSDNKPDGSVHIEIEMVNIFNVTPLDDDDESGLPWLQVHTEVIERIKTDSTSSSGLSSHRFLRVRIIDQANLVN